MIRGIDLVGKWTPEEAKEAQKILAPLPRAFVEDLPTFQHLDRQDVLTDAPPTAPGHSKYEGDTATIVVYDKGLYHGDEIDPEQFRRSIYHELAHAIVRHRPEVLDEWSHDTHNDGFVDDYAKTSPEEDFADTFSEYLINRSGVQRAVPYKARFLLRLFTRVAFH